MIHRITNRLDRLAREEIERSRRYKEAEVFSTPLLSRSDGVSSTYACDIRINGQTEVIKRVPIASLAGDVIYAMKGAAVTVYVDPVTGKMEVIGFAKRKPGFFHRYSLDLSLGTMGAVSDQTLTKRLLTYTELQSYGGGYGAIAYGSSATFRGTTLIEIGL